MEKSGKYHHNKVFKIVLLIMGQTRIKCLLKVAIGINYITHVVLLSKLLLEGNHLGSEISTKQLACNLQIYQFCE